MSDSESIMSKARNVQVPNHDLIMIIMIHVNHYNVLINLMQLASTVLTKIRSILVLDFCTTLLLLVYVDVGHGGIIICRPPCNCVGK